MRPTNTVESAGPCPHAALAQSALQQTRAAIARWRGSEPAAAPMRALPRVSPQARWLADAQFGLAAWIARGGFAQDPGAPVTPATPVSPCRQRASVAACID